MNLRDYQRDAVFAVVQYIETSSKNPCVVIPTGGGKTPIIATLARYFVQRQRARVLILSHRRELIEQTARTLERSNVFPSIYSAGLNKKEINGEIVVASIQSAAANIKSFKDQTPPFSFVFIDEAHLIPNLNDESSGYQQIIKALKENNERLRVVGFTATPYRLENGFLCSDDSILNKVVFEIKTAELIERGYLSPLITQTENQQERAADKDNEKTLETAVKNIVKATRNREKVLIFSPSIQHAREVLRLIRLNTNDNAEIVTGETAARDRERIVNDFKTPSRVDLVGRSFNPLKYLINVDVLTTGFDAPNVDAVVLLRRTQSRALYVQMIGRGLRLAENKKNCLVLDFAGNIAEHGALDDYAETITTKSKAKTTDVLKRCPKCAEILPRAAERCSCGYTFEAIRCPYCGAPSLLSFSHCQNCGRFLVSVPHADRFDNRDLITANDHDLKRNVKTITANVASVRYVLAFTRAGNIPMLKEELTLENGEIIKIYALFEHEGQYPREKARAFWTKRTTATIPQTSRQAFYYAIAGGLSAPKSISYKPQTFGEAFPKITRVNVTPKTANENDLNIENPFNLACKKCGSGCLSYVYARGSFKIVCASCGEVVHDFGNDETKIKEIESAARVRFLIPIKELY